MYKSFLFVIGFVLVGSFLGGCGPTYVVHSPSGYSRGYHSSRGYYSRGRYYAPRRYQSRRPAPAVRPRRPHHQQTVIVTSPGRPVHIESSCHGKSCHGKKATSSGKKGKKGKGKRGRGGRK